MMKIAEPGRIGDVEIGNRIVMAPMISNLANPDGCTNENHIAYLEERAKGGTGLIITEYTYINSINSRGGRNQSGVYTMDFVPKFRRLTERVHMHGAKAFIQLVHAGGKAFLDTNARPPMAPTATDYIGYEPREMTGEDIENVISDFVKAAKFAKSANFDGIELHGAHGYLIQEFISPALNRRADKYGGSFENRVRFPQEIVDGIRGSVDIAMGIRLSLYEDDQDGYGPDYGLKVAETLSGIDYVHFSAGRFAPPGSSSSFYGRKTHIAARLPRKARIPTIVVGSVTNASDAEKVMEKADFVAVGRAILADPFFASKIIGGTDPLRPCIRCNQACRDISLGEVRCTVNPDLGMEAVKKLKEHVHGEITIIGGGVKGMEAAMTAAKLGMKVSLYEAREALGGQLLDVQDEAKKAEFMALAGYYSSALERLGVKVVLGKKYEGPGLYCLPDVVFPDIRGEDTIRIDSNVYRYHDDALKLARNHKVEMTTRSLTSLDRVRAQAYREAAAKAGIRFVEKFEETAGVSIIRRHQYDIREAMISGREAVYRYLRENSTECL